MEKSKQADPGQPVSLPTCIISTKKGKFPPSPQVEIQFLVNYFLRPDTDHMVLMCRKRISLRNRKSSPPASLFWLKRKYSLFSLYFFYFILDNV